MLVGDVQEPAGHHSGGLTGLVLGHDFACGLSFVPVPLEVLSVPLAGGSVYHPIAFLLQNLKSVQAHT